MSTNYVIKSHYTRIQKYIGKCIPKENNRTRIENVQCEFSECQLLLLFGDSGEFLIDLFHI